MRLFEILLLLTTLPLITWPLFVKRHPRWLALLPITAALLIIIHLIFEKYRWQMVPAYGLTGALSLLEIWRWWRGPGHTRERRFLISSSFLGLSLFAFAFTLPLLMPIPRLLKPTGPYAVGTTILHLVDTNRDEFYTTEPGDTREFMAQIWYPALPNANAEPAPYIDRLDIAGPAFSTWLGLPSFLLDHVNLVHTNSFVDLVVAYDAAPFPVIFFSHGLRGFRAQNSTMVKELASHGYVVASIDHTYANMISVFPDGRITFYNPDIFSDLPLDPPRNANTLVGVWTEDVRFLLDQMTLWQDETGNPFNGRLDLTHVGIFGHSTGGGTAAEFCLRDERCRVGIGLDSWLEPVSDSVISPGISQPFMFINSPRWLGEDNSARGREIFARLSNTGYLLTVAETEHFDFSDLSLLSPITPQLDLTGTIDGPYSLGIQNAYVNAFFNENLKGTNEPLLAGETPYPEVQFERNGR